MKHRLGVIVPYRDRLDQLNTFTESICKYLEDKKIDYRVIVVEQDSKKLFNRGKLLNIGFLKAIELECTYVVFHDVDMLPHRVDYSYSDFPIHLATNEVDKVTGKLTPVFEEYFGGVTMFPVKDFQAINGYSNEYWGWGFEDDDLLHRCKLMRIPLDSIYKKNVGAKTSGLRFNGVNSYVKFKNNINYIRDFSIFVSFEPDELVLNHEDRDDTGSAFGVPGYDLIIGYNSYRRYVVELFDSFKTHHNIYSDIENTLHVNALLTFNARERKLTLYLNGKKVADKVLEHRLFNYKKEEFMYLGTGNPHTDDYPKFFRGVVDSFATFNTCLDSTQAKAIGENSHYGLLTPFDDYTSHTNVINYYDGKFIRDYKLIDLTTNSNDGEIVNCSIDKVTYSEEREVLVPKRRESKFKLLKHEENGFTGTTWKDINTRYNQLKFVNEFKKGDRDFKKDGLSNTKYKTFSEQVTNNIITLTVGI